MTEVATKERTLASELPDRIGQRVRLMGWVHAIRKFGAVNFLSLRDRSGYAQVILEPEQVERLAGLQVETVVAVEGTVAAEERAPGGIELHNAEVEVISPVTEVLPFEINKKVLKPSL